MLNELLVERREGPFREAAAPGERCLAAERADHGQHEPEGGAGLMTVEQRPAGWLGHVVAG